MHPINPPIRIHLALAACCVFVGALPGCMHIQLGKNAVNEAFTVGDLEQQEVLNNLAMFVYNPSSMPFFSYPNQTATTITDQGNAGLSAGWSRPITSGGTSTGAPKHFGDFLLSSLGLTANAQRTNQEGLVVTPVNDPRKLELMRCAYQTVVASCCGNANAVPRNCPDCIARFNTFYTGNPNNSTGDSGTIDNKAGGAITSECLKGPCWFHVGCEKDVPKDCPCMYVGHYCGVYVWVTADGREGLSRLTLAILDYATHDPPIKLTKQVMYNIDELGLPTTKNQGVATITATIGVDENPASLLNLSPGDEGRIEDKLKHRLLDIENRLSGHDISGAPKPSAGEIKSLQAEEEQIERQLDFLDEQLRAGALKQQYYQGTVTPSTAIINLPALQQAQQTLTPTQ